MDRLTTVSQTHERGPRAFMATGRADSARVFRSAVRHSRRIRILRVVIPAAVVIGGLAAVTAATWLDPLNALAKLPVNIGGLVVSGTKITMQQPKIAGFTRDERPYTITARAAAQDIKNTDVLELLDLDATMQMPDKDVFKLSARQGIWDAKADKLVLRQNIVVSTSSYEGHLSEAVVNVRTGHILSDKPVEVRMLQGTINANRLEVINSGEIIRFEQGVTLEMMVDGSIALSDGRTRTR
jgi:lipopolysaccharide export system protein LptC